MFGFIKQVFITLLSSIGSLASMVNVCGHTKFIKIFK